MGFVLVLGHGADGVEVDCGLGTTRCAAVNLLRLLMWHSAGSLTAERWATKACTAKDNPFQAFVIRVRGTIDQNRRR